MANDSYTQTQSSRLRLPHTLYPYQSLTSKAWIGWLASGMYPALI